MQPYLGAMKEQYAVGVVAKFKKDRGEEGKALN